VAGLGRKVWANEVLSQPDLQGYLQDQVVMVFANVAARSAAIPAPTEGMHSYQLDVHRPEFYNGTAWVPTQYGQVRGKIWRTAGFGSTLVNATETIVGMGASRVSGGFSTVPDALVVPYDGRYDLDWQGYLVGGATANVNFWFRRTRAGVADATVAAGLLPKTSTSTDAQMPFGARDIALKAADQLRLISYQYNGPVAYYGTTEVTGCVMTATYSGPLNGMTPI
jgi:hypothetical protein